MIGRRRPPSPLNDIGPDGWPASYTTELLGLINVLGLLVKLEPQQADLLKRIVNGAVLSHAQLSERGAFAATEPKKAAPQKSDDRQESLGI